MPNIGHMAREQTLGSRTVADRPPGRGRFKVKRNVADRHLPMITSAILVLALAACGDSDTSGGATTSPEGPVTTTAPEPTATVAGGSEPTPATSSVAAAVGFSGEVTIAGRTINLVAGCVNTFDPAGTGTVTAQYQGVDGTIVDVVVVADGEPTVAVVQEGGIWSNVSGAGFTVEINTDAGILSGSGLVQENRTTANPEADETPVAAEMSATWDPANPCP